MHKNNKSLLLAIAFNLLTANVWAMDEEKNEEIASEIVHECKMMARKEKLNIITNFNSSAKDVAIAYLHLGNYDMTGWTCDKQCNFETARLNFEEARKVKYAPKGVKAEAEFMLTLMNYKGLAAANKKETSNAEYYNAIINMIKTPGIRTDAYGYMCEILAEICHKAGQLEKADEHARNGKNHPDISNYRKKSLEKYLMPEKKSPDPSVRKKKRKKKKLVPILIEEAQAVVDFHSDHKEKALKLATQLKEYKLEASLPRLTINDWTCFNINADDKPALRAIRKPRIVDEKRMDYLQKSKDLYEEVLLVWVQKCPHSQLLHFDYGVFDKEGNEVCRLPYFELPQQ